MVNFKSYNDTDPFYRDKLDASCIYDAIDTYNMTKVVRAAINAFSPKSEPSLPKTKKLSASVRKHGNEYYQASKILMAVEFYNKALCFAPTNSEEMMLAYGNRSAVFFSIGYYSACLKDIDVCLSIGCSEALTTRYRKRRADASALLPKELEKRANSSEFVKSYLKFDFKRHADVTCASADVTFSTRDGGKRLSAGTRIAAGSVVAVERAFATVTKMAITYLSCYYCNKADLCLYPCEGCTLALFCGPECKKLCMKEYHSIECQILCNIGPVYDNYVIVLLTKTAIKLSLKMNWDEFITASKDIGAARMRKSTVKQAFSPEEPLSILSYDDNDVRNIPFLEGPMYNGSVVCAKLLYWLGGIKDYFPTEPEKREAAIDAMGRVMLNLFVSFTNTISINSSAYDFNSGVLLHGLLLHDGWFPMASKLRHSCAPNLLAFGMGDHVALVAVHSIQMGEELTIAYNGYPTDSSYIRRPGNRITQLYLRSKIMCDCRLCLENWNRSSAKMVLMTKIESTLVSKIMRRDLDYSFNSYSIICKCLDIFPVSSMQHVHAYDCLISIMNSVQGRFNNSVTITINGPM